MIAASRARSDDGLTFRKVPVQRYVKNFWQVEFAVRLLSGQQQDDKVRGGLSSGEPKGIYVELARRIKEHRERLGMSQGDLAKAVFVSRQTISNWETDRTYPDVQSLLLLSKLFGVTVDSLVKDDEEKLEESLAAESRRMSLLGIVMAAFTVACAAWVLASIALDLNMVASIVPAVVLIVPAMVAAGKIEKIRRDNKLFAYQSVEAFLSGRDPDVRNEFNERAGRHWSRKRVFQTVIAVIVGACCGWGLASIVSTLLGR